MARDKTYKKKDPVIRAFKFGVDEQPGWFMSEVTSGNITVFTEEEAMYCQIKTDHGFSHVDKGDYVILEEKKDGTFKPAWRDQKEFESEFEEIK